MLKFFMHSTNIQSNSDFEPVEQIPLTKHSIYSKINRIIQEMKPGSVLEVGCGSGRYLEHLKESGWKITGIDIQNKGKEFIRVLDVEKGFDLEQKFDLILACEVIEHIVDTEFFLENLSKHLKSNGRLIISTPNLLFWVNRVVMMAGFKPFFAYADFHVRMFVWRELSKKLSRHFSIVTLQGSHVGIGRNRNLILGTLASYIGDLFPKLSAHLIVQLHHLDQNKGKISLQ
jgi:SAM-dependent methyltransferase